MFQKSYKYPLFFKDSFLPLIKYNKSCLKTGNYSTKIKVKFMTKTEIILLYFFNSKV